MTRATAGRMKGTVGHMRIGVVGAGAIGRKHIALVRSSPDCELVGIADPGADAAAYAGAHGIDRYGDPLDLLTQQSPDGVIIAAPNALHLPVALACIERGIPCLIEKPVTDTVTSARALRAAAQRSGVPVLVGHHRRHNPIIKAARTAVANGTLGRLIAVNGVWLLRKPDSYFDVAWRRGRDGGPVLINMVHDIDSLRFICGEIAEVQAMTANMARGFDVEDTAAVLLRFENGAVGTMVVSDATPSPWSWELSSGENADYPRHREFSYLLAGTTASLSVPTMKVWSYPGCAGWFAPMSVDDIPIAPGDPLVAQLRHFRAVIAGTETPLVTVDDAMRTLAVVEAVRLAARSGQRIVPGDLVETPSMPLSNNPTGLRPT